MDENCYTPERRHGDVALQTHLEARIADLNRLIERTFREHERALDLASKALEARLDRLNDLREMVQDQQATFIHRENYETRMNRVDEDIRELRESRALLEGKASAKSVFYAYLISAAAIVLSLLTLLTRVLLPQSPWVK